MSSESSDHPIPIVLEVPPPDTAAWGEDVDLYARQHDVPGHDQAVLRHAVVLLIGCGGINSVVATGIARGGVHRLIIVDHDYIGGSNVSRQVLFTTNDVGRPKADIGAEALIPHLVGGGTIEAYEGWGEDIPDAVLAEADVIVVGVDNNTVRIDYARRARALGIPAVFAMLSKDGMRHHTFLQGPNADEACLLCAKPDLDPLAGLACANAVAASCFVVGAYAVFFAHRALMGWPEHAEVFNFRQGDLLSRDQECAALIPQRPDCWCALRGDGDER